jgi:hypothetical protein
MAVRHGFPMLSKPRFGYGSLGVRLLVDEASVRESAATPDVIIQPFLNPPDESRHVTIRNGPGIPLFTVYRDALQYSCQVIIGPDGSFAEPFCILNVMVNGKSERGEICNEAGLCAVARQFAAAVSEHGWRGPFNLQCRKLPDGTFCGFEMNGRLTGSTSARAWLGYDEVGLLVERFLGPNRLPPHPTVPDGVIMRFPTSYGVSRPAVQQLRETGIWEARERPPSL